MIDDPLTKDPSMSKLLVNKEEFNTTSYKNAITFHEPLGTLGLILRPRGSPRTFSPVNLPTVTQ